VILFHRTPAADAVFRDGFRDGSGAYGTTAIWQGVWLSDQPLDENDGASGDDLVVVHAPEDEIAEFEWAGEPSCGYREWLVPDGIVNTYPRQRWFECDFCGEIGPGTLCEDCRWGLRL
jgi:hypothetical protein